MVVRQFTAFAGTLALSGVAFGAFDNTMYATSLNLATLSSGAPKSRPASLGSTPSTGGSRSESSK